MHCSYCRRPRRWRSCKRRRARQRTCSGRWQTRRARPRGLRAHLEEALREELADSDPARLRAAQKRAAALEADLAAKQVHCSLFRVCTLSLQYCVESLNRMPSSSHSQAKAAGYFR